MSTDEKVTTDIIETLKDGEKGFTEAAERLANETGGGTAATLREFAGQRRAFATELEQLAAAYGDRIEEEGSVAATVHRGWLKLKDALTGDDPSGVLKACETGEDHAVSEYEKALGHDDLSANLRTVLERQFAEVRQARDTVAALAAASH